MTWQIDPMHAQVEFSAKHFGMMTVRGHFQHITATGQIDPANPSASSIEVTIDVTSLTTNNPQRDNDLRGSYFLELEKYPSVTFKSTRIEPAGPVAAQPEPIAGFSPARRQATAETQHVPPRRGPDDLGFRRCGLYFTQQPVRDLATAEPRRHVDQFQR